MTIKLGNQGKTVSEGFCNIPVSAIKAFLALTDEERESLPSFLDGQRFDTKQVESQTDSPEYTIVLKADGDKYLLTGAETSLVNEESGIIDDYYVSYTTSLDELDELLEQAE